MFLVYLTAVGVIIGFLFAVYFIGENVGHDMSWIPTTAIWIGKAILFVVEKTILGVWYLVHKESLKWFYIRRMWRDLGEYKIVEQYNTYAMCTRDYHEGFLLGFIPIQHSHTDWKGWYSKDDNRNFDSLRENILAIRFSRARTARKQRNRDIRNAYSKDVSIWTKDNVPVKESPVFKERKR